MKKGDFVIIIVGLLLSASIYMGYKFAYVNSDFKMVVVKSEGKVVTQLDIDATTNASYSVKNKYGKNEIVIKDGEVFIHSATCKNQICVNDGKIHDVGQSLICLPHRVSVEIIGKNKNREVDDISH